MKIVFLEAVQTYGGAQIAIMDLAHRLQAHGHDVHLVDCYGTCDVYIEQAFKRGISLHIVMQRKESYVIKKYNSKIRNGLRLVGFFFHWLKLKRSIRMIISGLAPSVVVCYNHKALSLINKLPDCKIAYYAHGWYLPQQIPRLMRNLILKKTDRIIAISQATRMALYASAIAPLENISVVHNAIDIDRLPAIKAQIPDSDGCYKILMCGGFLRDKGLHIAIEIAKELKNRRFPVKLIVTGVIYKSQESVMYSAYIDKMIERLDLSEVVHIVRDKSNVLDYFRACDCLIHPSSTEGLPLVIIEAMAMGKPVIVNAVGGVTDLVVDNFTGIIAPYNDIQYYADSIERIASDHKFRKMIINNATALVRQAFNPDVQVREFEQVLK